MQYRNFELVKNKRKNKGKKSAKNKTAKLQNEQDIKNIRNEIQNSKVRTTKIKNNLIRNNSSRNWLTRQLNDPFAIGKHKEGYRSRSIYKLMEIDEKFHLLDNVKTVIDLGAAPGGWTQLVKQRISISKEGLEELERLRESEKLPDHKASKCHIDKKISPSSDIHSHISSQKTKIIAIDLQDIAPIEDVIIIKGDCRDQKIEKILADILDNNKVDLIISDMAPNTTGFKELNHIRIIELAKIALDFAVKFLKPQGNFTFKLFSGKLEEDLIKEIRQYFTKVKYFKPNSSRADSSEIFIVALGFKGDKKSIL